MAEQTQVTEQRTMLSVAELKARGWTDGIIARHLGKPDRTTVNPYYRRGPRRNQYSMQRIIAAEQGPARPDLERAAERRNRNRGHERHTAEVVGGRFDGTLLFLAVVRDRPGELRILETIYPLGGSGPDVEEMPVVFFGDKLHGVRIALSVMREGPNHIRVLQRCYNVASSTIEAAS